MNWLRAVVLIAVFPVAHVLQGQMDAKGLELALKHRQFVLRSFSADPVAKYTYTWADGKLTDDPAKVHTLGVFTVEFVRLDNGKLSIQGNRSTLVLDTKNARLQATGSSPMTIEIDLSGADAATAIPSLQDSLFFPDVNTAISALPRGLGRTIPHVVAGSRPSGCGCLRFFDTEQWIEVPAPDKRFTHVKLIKTVDPEFSQEARDKKLSGSVALAVFVSAKGDVEGLWLLDSLGSGLDEAAEAAISKYQFAPAQYDGHAVGEEMTIEVKFDIF